VLSANFDFVKFCRFIFVISFLFPLLVEPIELLKNLDYENEVLKKLRSEVKYNLKVSKSKNNSDDYIPLEFYKYTVVQGDNFFRIMARTGMNIDTISSVNALSSPQDIRVGMTLLIPNMRGVYDTENLPENEHSRGKLAEKYSMPNHLIIFDKRRDEWFVPGKTLGKIEKSFFYGLAFNPPLNEGYLTSGFGHRLDPFTKKKTFHGGLDIAAPKGTDVISSADGEVIFVGRKGGYGKLIVVKHIMGYETRYGHLDKMAVSLGDHVKKGQKIGNVGNTGRATGYHLHYEVRRFQKNEKPVFYQHM
jgi:murein DD-endopeptidase MepM/ murein hydrolase activator NlpD